MFFAAAALTMSSPCSPTAIAENAVVSPVSQEDGTELGLSHLDPGFRRPSVQQVAWRACAPMIVGLYGGNTLVTASGLLLWTRGGPTLQLRGDPILPADTEPAHPNWEDHRFAGSASLAAGTWRVGLWVGPGGITDVARYRPGDPAHPIILMTSALPIVGLFYLGAPDSVGGTLFFAQRLGRSNFRMISMPWSEAGLRIPNQ